MEKQFFLPGDVVKLKQPLPYAPTMYVVKKVTKIICNKIRKHLTSV